MVQKILINCEREKAIAAGLVMPTEEVCKRYHNEESPHYKGFNFEEYKAKIAHPILSKTE